MITKCCAVRQDGVASSGQTNNDLGQQASNDASELTWSSQNTSTNQKLIYVLEMSVQIT